MTKKQCGPKVSPRSLLAIRLLEFLEKEKIPYVVVGDSRSFPTKIEGDLDIVVGSQSIEHISRILFRFSALCNVRMVQVLQHEQTAFYHVLAITEKNVSVQFLHPDICGDYFRKGKLLLKAEEILKGRVRALVDKERTFAFFVPDHASAFLYYFLKKIDKGSLASNEGAYLSQQWARDPVKIGAQLKRFCSVSDIENISKAAEENRWEEVQIKLPGLRKGLHRNLKPRFKHYLGELQRIINRIFKPTGIHVVFLGTDGSGKSSVLAKVMEDLTPAFRTTKSYHLRPFFGSRRSGGGLPNHNPQSDPVRGAMSSIAKLGFWWLDFTVGYLIEILPRKICSTLLVFDRYYFDILVDPQRYRYGGPKILARMVAKLIPQPDIVILLDAPVEIIQSRKCEVSVEETTRQREAYLSLLTELSQGYVVDASKPISEVIDQVEEIILTFMAGRTYQRMRVTE